MATTEISYIEAVDDTAVSVNVIAEELGEIVSNYEANSSSYDVPINTAPEILEGEYITFDLDKVMVYVDAEYAEFDWEVFGMARVQPVLS